MSVTLSTGRVVASGATPSRWLWLLHGIYGAGRNWNAVARRFVEASRDWGVLAIDLRGHGGSDRGAPPHTVLACAGDLLDLADRGSAPPPNGVLGHSFGGKVAILFAEAAELEYLRVIDSTPSAREAGGSAWRMLDVLTNHPGPFPDRSAGIAAVASEGYATPVAQWMGTNLVRDESGAWRWRLDPAQMEDLLLDFFARDAWPALELAARAGTDVEIVKASESSVVSDDDVARARELGSAGLPVRVVEVDGGHWLNADAPERVAGLLAEGLSAAGG